MVKLKNSALKIVSTPVHVLKLFSFDGYSSDPVQTTGGRNHSR
jgi:hypothetical protein